MRLRWRNNEAEYTGNGSVFHAGSADVCFQDTDGAGTEYSLAGSIYHCVYGGVPGKGIIPDLHLCVPKRTLCGLCYLVDSVSVYLVGALGRDHVVAEKDAKAGGGGGICS